MKSIERLLQYIDYKGLNKRTFEVNNDLSNGYLGKQLSRNADLGEGILTRILDNCPDLSPEWLLTGKGEMIVNNDTKVESNEKPSEVADGWMGRYVSLLERTVEDLESKIAKLKDGNTGF